MNILKSYTKSLLSVLLTIKKKYGKFNCISRFLYVCEKEKLNYVVWPIGGELIRLINLPGTYRNVFIVRVKHVKSLRCRTVHQIGHLQLIKHQPVLINTDIKFKLDDYTYT